MGKPLIERYWDWAEKKKGFWGHFLPWLAVPPMLILILFFTIWRSPEAFMHLIRGERPLWW